MAQYDGELTRLVEQVNRSAKGPIGDESKLLDQFLTLAVERHASDLLFVANSPAVLRVNGVLTGGIGQTLSPSELRGILLSVLTPEQVEELQTVLTTGKSEGMLTMEQALAELVLAGHISRDVAFDHSPCPEDLQRHLS